MSDRPIQPDATPPTADGEKTVPSSSPRPGDAALWGDTDAPETPNGDFSGLVAAPAPRVMPTIGHIGRYALKYQLGAGGAGTVYAAHDPLLSRLIAVKTLNVEVSDAERESFNALFLNEARAAGGLSHPHIVTVFDAGISDDRAYIAMALLKGRDLRRLREEGWRPTPAQAALIVRRVADALAFAHSRGVIHRDIKPANIFMVGRTQPRVLDFGIASIAHRRDESDALRGAGSPFYMAPEQIRHETVDRRADVFSLGVVFYELLADCKPFGGDSLEKIRGAVLAHEPPSAHKIDRAVPKALAEIAARAMAKDPDQRFRSTRSFARELRQWLDENPVVPHAEATVAPPLRRRAKAGRVAAGVAVVATAAIAAVIWAAQHGSAPIAGMDPVQAQQPLAPAPASSRALPVPLAAEEPDAVAATLDAGTMTSAAPATAASSAIAAVPPAPQPSGDREPSAGGQPIAAVDARQPALSTTQAAAAPATASAATTTSASTALRRSDTGTALPPRVAETREAAARQKRAREAVDAREREAREQREREARDARERQARQAAATPAAPTTGTLKIAISPWGQVEVDGAGVGVAPPLTELTLTEGRHRIVVRNGDFAPFVTSIDVGAGRVVTLRYKFGS